MPAHVFQSGPKCLCCHGPQPDASVAMPLCCSICLRSWCGNMVFRFSTRVLRSNDVGTLCLAGDADGILALMILFNATQGGTALWDNSSLGVHVCQSDPCVLCGPRVSLQPRPHGFEKSRYPRTGPLSQVPVFSPSLASDDRLCRPNVFCYAVLPLPHQRTLALPIRTQGPSIQFLQVISTPHSVPRPFLKLNHMHADPTTLKLGLHPPYHRVRLCSNLDTHEARHLGQLLRR